MFRQSDFAALNKLTDYTHSFASQDFDPGDGYSRGDRSASATIEG
jgi:hypothetical protein